MSRAAQPRADAHPVPGPAGAAAGGDPGDGGGRQSREPGDPARRLELAGAAVGQHQVDEGHQGPGGPGVAAQQLPGAMLQGLVHRSISEAMTLRLATTCGAWA